MTTYKHMLNAVNNVHIYIADNKIKYKYVKNNQNCLKDNKAASRRSARELQ